MTDATHCDYCCSIPEDTCCSHPLCEPRVVCAEKRCKAETFGGADGWLCWEHIPRGPCKCGAEGEHIGDECNACTKERLRKAAQGGTISDVLRFEPGVRQPERLGLGAPGCHCLV